MIWSGISIRSHYKAKSFASSEMKYSDASPSDTTQDLHGMCAATCENTVTNENYMRIRTYEYKRYEKLIKDIHDTRREKVVCES